MMRFVGWRDRFLGERHQAPVDAEKARRHGRLLWVDRRSWPSELPPGWDATELCRWLLVRHSTYVDLDGVALKGWLSALSAKQFKEFEAASGALLRSWLARTRATLRRDAVDDVAYLAACIRTVAELTVSGHELGSRDAQRYWPHIAGSAYPRGAAARLLRGVTSCDGVSYWLAELVAPDFETCLIRVASHRLVEVRAAGARIYLDAHAALPPFVVDGVAPAGVLTVEELGERFHCTPEYDDRVLSAATYREVRGRIGLHPLKPKRWPSRIELSRGAYPVAEATPWDAYLEARVHHLFGSREDALSGYRRVVSGADQDPTAHLARGVAAVAADHITRGNIDRRRLRLDSQSRKG